MRRELRIIDLDTDQVLEEIEFVDGYNLTLQMDAEGKLKHINKLDHGKYDECTLIRNDYFRAVAQKLIEKFPELRHIRPEKILFLEHVDWEPGTAKNPWRAQVKLANKQMVAMTGYDYVMEFRRYYLERMGKAQVIALVYHELRHIDIDGGLRKHDIEDWSGMIGTLGADWASTQAEILNLLDNEFPGWFELKRAGNQMDLFIHAMQRDRAS